jgi:septal ring factor EnvC (AmiA/AmiB activator)
MQKAIDKLEASLELKEATIQDLSRKLKHVESEKSMDLREVKARNAKLTKELEELKAQYAHIVTENQVCIMYQGQTSCKLKPTIFTNHP